MKIDDMLKYSSCEVYVGGERLGAGDVSYRVKEKASLDFPKPPAKGPLYSQPTCPRCKGPVWTPKRGSVFCYYCGGEMTFADPPLERERRPFEDVVSTSGTTYVDCSFST